MPSLPLLGDGVVISPASHVSDAGDGDNLRQMEDLKSRLRVAQVELDRLRAENTTMKRSVEALKDALAGQFYALKAIFGEIEIVTGPTSSPFSSASSRFTNGDEVGEGSEGGFALPGIWEQWKQKLGGKSADFIQALWDHRLAGGLTKVQLKTITKSGASTVDLIVGKLSTLGLLVKDGAKWSLKQL